MNHVSGVLLYMVVKLGQDKKSLWNVVLEKNGSNHQDGESYQRRSFWKSEGEKAAVIYWIKKLEEGKWWATLYAMITDN